MPLGAGSLASVGPFLDGDDSVWVLPDIAATCLAALVGTTASPCSTRSTHFVDLALWQDSTAATRWTAYPITSPSGCCVGVLTIGLAPPWVPGWAPPDATLLDVPLYVPLL